MAGIRLLTVFFCLCLMALAPAARADEIADRIRRAQTPNEVLGIRPDATQAEAKRAYIEMARRYHLRAGSGDAEANELMQKVNAANEYLNKPPVEGSRPRTWSYGSSGQSSGGGARSSGAGPDVWQSFYSRMAAARTPEERNRLRDEQLKHVRTASDFVRVVAADVNPANRSGAREAKDFAVKNMSDFVARNPKLSDLNELAQVANLTEGGRMEVYRSALQSAKSASQFTELMRPQLSMSNGGDGWIRDLEGASRSEMYRFFLLNPSREEVSRMNGLLSIGFRRGVGEAMFFEGLEKAAHIRSGKPAETYRAGMFRGLGNGLLGRFVNRLLSVDPSLVTGVVRGIVEEKEALSLNTATCPPGLLATPRLVSTSYLQLLSVIGPQDQELILQNCAAKDKDAEQKLRDLLGKTLTANREALKLDPNSIICHPKNGISFKSTTGLQTQIDFGPNGSVRQIRSEPVSGKGNINHFISYSFENHQRPVSYSSFPYPKNKKIDLPGTVSEGETSFFLRLACASQICGDREFLANTDLSDDNIFSLELGDGNSPTYRKPFGDMQTEFLEEGGMQMHRLLGLVRSQKITGPGALAKICEMLKSKVPIELQATPAPTDAATAPFLEQAEGRD